MPCNVGVRPSPQGCVLNKVVTTSPPRNTEIVTSFFPEIKTVTEISCNSVDFGKVNSPGC